MIEKLALDILAIIVSVLTVISVLAYREKLSRRVWIVGEFRGATKRGLVVWTLKGVYTSRSRAFNACADRLHFMVCVPVDSVIPEEGDDLPKCHYPKAKTEAVNA